jgi:hypothetical protein
MTRAQLIHVAVPVLVGLAVMVATFALALWLLPL